MLSMKAVNTKKGSIPQDILDSAIRAPVNRRSPLYSYVSSLKEPPKDGVPSKGYLTMVECKMCGELLSCNLNSNNPTTDKIQRHLKEKHEGEPEVARFFKSKEEVEKKEEPVHKKLAMDVKVHQAHHQSMAKHLCIGQFIPPNSIATGKGWERYIQETSPGLPVPSRQKLTALADTAAAAIRQGSLKAFKTFVESGSSLFSISFDSWTSDAQTKSFEAVTAYWVNDHWQTESIPIRMVMNEGGSTSDEIGPLIMKLLVEAGGTAVKDRLLGAVTDAAPNMQALQNREPFSDYHMQLCAPHKLDRIPCSILHATVVTESCRMSNALSKVSAICSKLHQSTQMAGRWEKFNGRSIRNMNDTRWSSQLLQLRDYHDQHELLVKFAKQEPDLPPALTDLENLKLGELITLLRPMESMTDLLQSSSKNTVTLSSYLPAARGMIKYLKKPCQYSDVDKLRLTMLEKAEEVLGDVSLRSDLLAASSYLDPRFKHSYLDPESDKELINTSTQLIEEIVEKHVDWSSTASDEDTEPTTKKQKIQQERDADFDTIFGIDDGDSGETKAQKLQKEIRDYDFVPKPPIKSFDVLGFWKGNSASFPLLSGAAKSLYSMQGTSADLERLFSQASLFVTQKRSRLSPTRIENWLLAHQTMYAPDTNSDDA